MKKILVFILILSCPSIGIGYAAENNTVIPEVTTNVQSSTVLSKPEQRVQTTQITREDITNSPVLNLSSLLAQEQSIVRLTNNSGDSSQTALSIRGFGNNAAANTLILVDGFPLTNPSILAPNFNSIALSDIERIDIIEGSQGTLWGDQAVGGVVNIVTRHPEKFLADVNLGVGSFNQYFYSALVGTKFKNGFFFKGFGFSNRTDNYRQHNRHAEETGFFQTGWDYARGTLNVSAQSYENTIQLPSGLTQAQFAADPQQSTDLLSHTHYKTVVYQFFNQHALNAHWLLETRLSNRTINGDGEINGFF
ncbi:MAG TPA: TonB-dependent receptor plug domain-containing protein, partial [Gammaproteobacteria bacterium]|nr:TonB-dependent receptor plug domain-containing protein [Gammaproteobacteria bacterium]